MRSIGMQGSPPARMYVTVKELLWRQRQIEVFPYDNGKVLRSLYPNAMQGIKFDDTEFINWANIGVCLERARSVVVEIKGEAGHAFWMKFRQSVVAPIAGSSLALPESNHHYGEIKLWWDRAMEIHTELGKYQDALWAFLSRADHPLLVEKYWPELLPFVTFAPLLSHAQPDLNRRRTVPMPSQEIRDGIITTLAGSTLLAAYECSAWVDYEAEK